VKTKKELKKELKFLERINDLFFILFIIPLYLAIWIKQFMFELLATSIISLFFSYISLQAYKEVEKKLYGDRK